MKSDPHPTRILGQPLNIYPVDHPWKIFQHSLDLIHLRWIICLGNIAQGEKKIRMWPSELVSSSQREGSANLRVCFPDFKHER
jgi:hypothetical protein